MVTTVFVAPAFEGDAIGGGVKGFYIGPAGVTDMPTGSQAQGSELKSGRQTKLRHQPGFQPAFSYISEASAKAASECPSRYCVVELLGAVSGTLTFPLAYTV